MAQVIWTYSAQSEFDSIAQFIAWENPAAAARFVSNVMIATKQLARFPRSGPRIPELPQSRLRQLVVRPCRIFYRMDKNCVQILHIMRQERLFRKEYVGL